jgi:hypothetical protein
MRQAVVIIHGIGEQLPMETLRGFVTAVVEPPPTGARLFYSKPDRISDTLELRRLTANKNYTHDNPTDFYELYWQHLMTGTTFAHIQAWLGTLLLRCPESVPRRLRLAWWLTWSLIVLTIGSLSLYSISLRRLPFVEGIGVIVLFFVVRPLERFGLKYVGDAARYLSPFPENVAIRHAIRSAGLELLRGLHHDPLRRYQRLIVVGHSLGSVIAYDVLTHLWQEMHSKVERLSERNGKPELEELHHLSEKTFRPSRIAQRALDDLTNWVEKMAQEPPKRSEQLTLNLQYRRHQRELWDEYRDMYKDKDEHPEFQFPWRVTDLVTLGSPLTYAEFLLAKNSKEFSDAKDQREFPTCPPRRADERDDQKHGDRGLLTRVLPGKASERGWIRILHHGALFACTRWTNLYFPGDIIGGPLAFAPDPTNPAKRVELFGVGVRDVKLHGPSEQRKVSHRKYWEAAEHSAVKALRDALNLDLGERSLGVRLPQ